MISSTGCRWVINNTNSGSILSKLLKNRGVADDAIDDFLNPTLKRLIPDPSVLKDMERGVDRVYEAIRKQERFLIVGDYDVDGVTSTALLTNYLHQICYTNFDTYIPHRVHDGYGLNKGIIDKFEAKLVITVDNGSTAYDVIDYANSLGKDVVILDHHTMEHLPNSYALINPHRPDARNSDLSVLCAAGVVFLFLIAFNRKLKNEGFFQEHVIAPDLRSFLDIVALGTVCDAMQMIGINRALVSYGLKIMSNTQNVGLRELISSLNTAHITEETLGFFIGPRLNAAGRLENADLSLQLLTTTDKDRAIEICKEIDNLNARRQSLEALILEDTAGVKHHDTFICAYNDGWHIGVIGIVAGKLKEMHNLPTFVVTFDEDGNGHGSARSANDVDLAHVINLAKEKRILTKGGGHKLAAGFSLRKDRIADFIDFLKQEITQEPVMKEIQVDCSLPLSSATKKLVDEINRLAPFGQSNEVPKFIINHVRIKSYSVIGKRKNHLSLVVYDELGNTKRCIAFNAVNHSLGNEIISRLVSMHDVSILVSLSLNEWNGYDNVSLNILDILFND